MAPSPRLCFITHQHATCICSNQKASNVRALICLSFICCLWIPLRRDEWRKEDVNKKVEQWWEMVYPLLKKYYTFHFYVSIKSKFSVWSIGWHVCDSLFTHLPQRLTQLVLQWATLQIYALFMAKPYKVILHYLTKKRKTLSFSSRLSTKPSPDDFKLSVLIWSFKKVHGGGSSRPGVCGRFSNLWRLQSAAFLIWCFYLLQTGCTDAPPIWWDSATLRLSYLCLRY